jgi:hypothetical protein
MYYAHPLLINSVTSFCYVSRHECVSRKAKMSGNLGRKEVVRVFITCLTQHCVVQTQAAWTLSSRFATWSYKAGRAVMSITTKERTTHNYCRTARPVPLPRCHAHDAPLNRNCLQLNMNTMFTKILAPVFASHSRWFPQSPSPLRASSVALCV